MKTKDKLTAYSLSICGWGCVLLIVASVIACIVGLAGMLP